MILSIVSGLLQLGLFFFGNAFLTKWLGALQFILDKGQNAAIKEQVAANYKLYSDAWEAAKKNDPTRAG